MMTTDDRIAEIETPEAGGFAEAGQEIEDRLSVLEAEVAELRRIVKGLGY